MSNETMYAEIATAAAAAGAAVMPAVEQLSVGAVTVGDAQVAAAFAGAVVADLEGAVPGRVALLVGQELVDALASSPLGGLDLAAALQPTLDAVAGALQGRVGAARESATGLVTRDLSTPFTAVYLKSGDVAAVLLLPDDVLAGAQNAVIAAAASGAEPAIPGAGTAPGASGAVLSSIGGLEHRTARPGIEMLHGVDMEVTVEIGRTRMTVRDLLDLTPGAVLELDRAAGSPADLLVNGRLIARGEVVVIDEDFGLRITEIAVDAAAS
ncbi:flagellar motor switch protein FliN [Nocardioides sp. YIM 152315]|uniref:flagellar motor switch protein FliN n=1 Tax=Nocardioides sp. YIM 152315 TaxID=3031760 RepID=UPI0023DABFE5|nr:flagellar motor switch protein FliN [Nocardioides sp. YIM 152315]MDF1605976.1 flagellar motor switch protein FliN [Nocardioides sp. YIM 152315]